MRTDWASYRHHSDNAIFAEAWKDAGFDGDADLTRLETRFELAFDRTVRVQPLLQVPGRSDLLCALEHTEWAVCFATEILRYRAMRKLEVLSGPIDHDLLVTASEFQTREDIVSAAIERTICRHGLCDTKRIVSVGDGLWDMETAQSLGLEFCAIAPLINRSRPLYRGTSRPIHSDCRVEVLEFDAGIGGRELPIGLCVIGIFSEGRKPILQGWLLHRKALRAIGFGTGFEWIDGSFAEKGKEPKDIDTIPVPSFSLPLASHDP